MYNTPTTDDEAQELLDRLEQHEDQFYIDNMDALITMMKEISYQGIRDLIAVKFGDIKLTQALPAIINVIIEGLDTKAIGRLIYACMQFDCSSYWPLFTDILVLKSDSNYMRAAAVIHNMKKLDDFTWRYIKKKISLCMMGLPADSLRYEKLSEVYNYIEADSLL